jgi:type IV fimbrial biogenesis protein FimT
LLEPLTVMTRRPAPSRPRGLTLLEMMVSLAIVAVLASLAAPSFGSMMARHRLKAAADHLAMDLAELRFEATRRGLPLHLQLTPGTEWCYAMSTAPGCDCRLVQSCQLKTVQGSEFPGVQLVQAQDLHFEPVVLAGAPRPAALLQGRDGAQLRVGLSPLGRPSVCAPGQVVPGYPACKEPSAH